MADLGNLWFSLGLDDTKLQQQWKAAYDKYLKQAKIDVGLNFDPSVLPNLKTLNSTISTLRKGKGNIKTKIDIDISPRTMDALRNLAQLGNMQTNWKAAQQAARAAGVYAREQARANNITLAGQQRINSNYQKQSLWLKNLHSLIGNYLSIYGIKNFVTNLAQVTGEFEKQRVTLQAMVGEMQGLEIFGQMKKLAIVSPFEFKDLTSYARQLAAFSVPYSELYDTTKKLADISAGLGVDMSRIILAFGQIRSAGVLKGTELRQLTEAGVPILDKLADKLSKLKGEAVGIGEIFGMISQKMIPFEMVAEVFDELTSEGGQFFQMQAIQAETLAGKISNLKDAWSIMLSEIGEQKNNWLKGGIEILYDMIKNWERLGRIITTVALGFGAFQLGRIIQSWGMGIAKLIHQFNLLRASSNSAGRAMAGALTKSGGWAALLGIVTALVAHIWQLVAASRQFKKEFNEILNTQTSELQSEIDALERLSKAITDATEGTEKRREAIEAYNKRFGQYLENALDEVNANDAIAASNDRITQSLQNRYKEEALLRSKKAVEDKYGVKVDDIETSYIDNAKWVNLTKEARYAVASVKRILEQNINADLWDDVYETFKKEFEDDKLAWNLAQGFEPFMEDFRDAYKEYLEQMNEVKKKVDESFDVDTFSTFAIEKKFKEYTDAYNRTVEKIKDNSKLSKAEVDEKLKQEEIAYLTKLTELYKDLPQHLEKYKVRLDELTFKQEAWKKDIKEIAKEFDVSDFFTPQKKDDYLGYIKKVREEYKDIIASIKDLQGSDPEGLLPGLENRRDFFEKIASKYGFSLDTKADQKALKAQKDAVAKLKHEYEGYLAVYKAFLKLKDKTGRTDIAVQGVSAEYKDYAEWLKGYTSKAGGIEQLFQDVFDRIAKDAIKKGGETGEQFVDNMTNALSSLSFKGVISTLDLAQQIKEGISQWELEDFLLTGSGVTLDLSKILKTQAEADNKAYARRKELLDKITKASLGDEAEKAAARAMYGENWASEAEATINRLTDLEIANNKKVADDKIRELGKTYAKEAIEGNFSDDFFSNLAEKTLAQLEDASVKLQGMINSPSFLMDTDYLDKIAGGELSQEQIEGHIRLWKEYINLLRSDVDIQHFEKVKKKLTQTGKAISNVIDSVKELAGNDTLFTGLLDGLGIAIEAGTTIADSFSKVKKENEETGEVTTQLEINWANMATAALQVAVAIAKNVIAAKQYRDEMVRANTEFKRGVTENAREIMITGEKFDTIFGENLLGALKADSTALKGITSDLKNASRTVADMKIKTRKGFFGIGAQYTRLHDLAPQLFKPDGSVDYEYLDEFLDAYGDKMSESQKALLEHLKNTYEQYQDIMEDTSEYLSNIFSDTASTIADRMIEAFAITGDAATGLGDLVNGVAKQMAKDLIQSLLIEQYLTPAMDRIKALYDTNSTQYEQDSVIRTQKAVLAMQDAIQAAGEAVPEVNKLLEALQAMGIDLNADAENASNVLSGLTEDQQNLLMGYINGIRSDVSINKGLLVSIVNTVGTVNNNIATAIVVWKQIEANTHRSADGVDRIIGFFESVMGPYDGGGGQAFKVNIA